jgi:hypothetical protein
MRHLLQALALSTLLGFGGCATVTTGTTQTLVVFVVGPASGECVLQQLDYRPVTLASGKEVSIPRGDAPLAIRCSGMGFNTASVLVQPRVHERARIGLPFGMLVDHLSGARYEYPAQVTVTLTPVVAASSL